MRSIAYTRYNGEDLDISAEDLMKALADFLLDSGFNDPYFQYGANTLDDLRNAIEYAMAAPGTHSDNRLRKALEAAAKFNAGLISWEFKRISNEALAIANA